MKFNKRCVNNMCKLFVGCLIVGLAWGCEQVDPEFEKLMTEDYAQLYQSVFERDVDAILVFTSRSTISVCI